MAVLKRVLLAVMSAAVPALVAMTATAADLQWQSRGNLPGGNPSFSVAQDPASASVTWAATSGSGLERTTDGKTWNRVAPGLLPDRLWKIAIDPSKGPAGAAPMYVGSAGEGVFKSLDGGKTWTGSIQGLASRGARNVRAIAMGVNQLVVGTSDGLFKSGDGGKSWQAAGLQGDDISAVAYARLASPAIVVAAIDGVNNPGSRVVLSKDGGATWAPIKQGVPGDIVVSAIAAGTVRPDANLRTVYLAGSAGVFKSDDQGQTWGQLSGLPAQGYGSLATSPADSSIVYVGSDGGGSGNGGVWRSTDRGGSWTALPNGISEKGVTAIAVGRDNPATLVAVAWNADKPVAPVYAVSDTQAPPGGQPEGGVCPEPSCQGNVEVQPAPLPTVTPSPSPSPTPCLVSPSPSPKPSGSVSPTASPSGPKPTTTGATPSAQPCPTSSASLPGPPHNDIPVPLAIGAVVVLAALLVGSIVVTRLRG